MSVHSAPARLAAVVLATSLLCIDPALGNDQRCRALCDAMHPCAAGTCQMYGSAGFCGS